jgi:flagellin
MAQADFTRISTNIAALNNLNSLRSINTKLGTAQLRLATGKRINQASDDPAGLTIAMKLNARNEGLKASLGNIGDAKNMLSVAEGGLQQINDLLIEMKSKATSAASDTLGADERAAIGQQLQSLAKQINDIVSENKWNGTSLLDGTVDMALQTGASETDTTRWMMNTGAVGDSHNATGIGVANGSLTDVTLSAAGGSGAATVGASFDTTDLTGRPTGAGASASTAFIGLTQLDTGMYKLKVVDRDIAGSGAAAIMELYKVNGNAEELVGVDDNGTDDAAPGTNTTALQFTMDISAAAASYDTGRGLKVFLNAFAGGGADGDVSKLMYTKAGEVSVDVSTSSAARDYMTAVDGAIAKVSGSLNNIGSLVGRLNSKEITVGVEQVNTEASYNRIMNADMAYEQVESAKYQILQQTAVAMLAQANAAPQGILSLFR